MKEEFKTSGFEEIRSGIVKEWGNGAHITFLKKHTGKKVKVIVYKG